MMVGVLLRAASLLGEALGVNQRAVGVYLGIYQELLCPLRQIEELEDEVEDF